MPSEFLGNIVLKGKMTCLTGLHIGGSKERFEIGGVDAPIIRDPNTNYPYIPGSSLKGKMRALLSFELGLADQDPPNSKDPQKNIFHPDSPLQRVFGIPSNFIKNEKNEKPIGPTRLIVRDAYPDKETQNMWKTLDSELLYTELKPENYVNRLTSAATPRFLERIVKDSTFNVEFIFGIYNVDSTKDLDYFKYVIEALRLLEHSALGGSGSRGYGQVEFRFMEPIVVLKNDYIQGSSEFKKSSKDIDSYLEENYKSKEGMEKWHIRLSDMDSNYIQDKILKKFSGN